MEHRRIIRYLRHSTGKPNLLGESVHPARLVLSNSALISDSV